MNLTYLGKILIGTGIVLFVCGLFFFILGKAKFSFHMPGDISIQKENYSFNFPIVTCIVISILLTLILNVIFWFFRK